MEYVLFYDKLTGDVVQTMALVFVEGHPLVDDALIARLVASGDAAERIATHRWEGTLVSGRRLHVHPKTLAVSQVPLLPGTGTSPRSTGVTDQIAGLAAADAGTGERTTMATDFEDVEPELRRALGPALTELKRRGASGRLSSSDIAAVVAEAIIADTALLERIVAPEGSTSNSRIEGEPEGSRRRLDVEDLIVVSASMIAMGGALARQGPHGSFADILDKVKKLGEDLKPTADAAKGIGEGAKGIGEGAKGVGELAKDISKAVKGSQPDKQPNGPGPQTGTKPPGPPAGQPASPPPLPTYEELIQIYGRESATEPAYTVWIDRIVSHENEDALGADNVFWFAHSKVTFEGSQKPIYTAVGSDEYDLDNHDEIRLSPLSPQRVPRFDHHAIRTIDDKDACIAARPFTANDPKNGEPIWIREDILRAIEIDFYLMENGGSIKEFADLVAALAQAFLTAMAYYTKGAAGDSSASAKDIQNAIEKLLAFIFKDEKLVHHVFAFTRDDIKQAFAGKSPNVFEVPAHMSTAAIGTDSRRFTFVRAHKSDHEDAEALKYLRNPSDTSWMYDVFLRFERRPHLS